MSPAGNTISISSKRATADPSRGGQLPRIVKALFLAPIVNDVRHDIRVGPSRNVLEEAAGFDSDAVRHPVLLNERRRIAHHMRHIEQDAGGSFMPPENGG